KSPLAAQFLQRLMCEDCFKNSNSDYALRRAIWDLADEFPAKLPDGGFGGTCSFYVVSAVMRPALFEIEDAPTRKSFVLSLLRNSKSVGAYVWIAEDFNKLHASDNRYPLATDAELKHFKTEMLSRLRKAAQSRCLLNSENLAYLIYAWKSINP